MSGSGYSGDLPPPRFNLSRHCLAPGAEAHPDKTALIVAADAADAGSDETWTCSGLEGAVLGVAHGLG
ncbi:MAG: AMP-dependent synthetase, partial [Hyphomicrobiales bacterium]